MLPAVLPDIGIAFQDGRDPIFGANAPSVNTGWMGKLLLWEVKLVSGGLVNGEALGGLLSEPSSWNILSAVTHSAPPTPKDFPFYGRVPRS